MFSRTKVPNVEVCDYLVSRSIFVMRLEAGIFHCVVLEIRTVLKVRDFVNRP